MNVKIFFIMLLCTMHHIISLDESFSLQEFKSPLSEISHLAVWKDKDGIILPKYTKPFLDVLVTWDIKNWDVFEWGLGYSSIWFAKHCKSITTAQTSKKWTEILTQELKNLKITNATIKLRPPSLSYASSCFGSGGEESEYVLAIDEDDMQYDCIIIDGIYRTACGLHVLQHLKPGGIIIINRRPRIDFTDLLEMFQSYEHHSFLEIYGPYKDWRTDFWKINT